MKKLLVILIALMFSFLVYADKTEITLTADNTLVLNTEINGETVVKIMEQATKMNASLKSGYPIYLVMYTPGGSIEDGLELMDFLAGMNRPIHTISIFSASMGFQIAQGLGTRYITRYGILMSHKARGGISGEFGDGVSQFDARYGLWLRRIKMLDEVTVTRTNGKQTLKTYRDSYANELWLNGEEAVTQGYADAVTTVKCDSSLDGTYDITLNFMGFSILVSFSKCPTKTYPLDVKVNIYTNKGTMTLDQFRKSGGQFGKECMSSSTNTIFSDGYGKIDNNPCALDTTLTEEKILNTIIEKRKYYNRDLKNSIVYSY